MWDDDQMLKYVVVSGGRRSGAQGLGLGDSVCPSKTLQLCAAKHKSSISLPCCLFLLYFFKRLA